MVPSNPLSQHVLLVWAQSLRQQQVWHLPKEVELLQEASKLSNGKQELLGIVLGALSFFPMVVHGTWVYFVLFSTGLLAYCVVLWRKGPPQTAIMRLDMGCPSGQAPHRCTGSVVNLPARSAQALGQKPVWQADFHDALAWSLGVHVMGGRRVTFYLIELRHARKGPVGVLCTLHCAVKLGRQDLLAIDALVDTMAECLGVRRTGTRLHPLKPRQ